jgi:hypothetical protein
VSGRERATGKGWEEGAGGAGWEAGGRRVGFVGVGGSLYARSSWKVGRAGLVGRLAQFGFAVRFGSAAHDKHSLSCASCPRRTAKFFFIYLYFNFITGVNVLKLSNGKENLP